MLQEIVNACFWPMVFSEGFVVRKNVDAFRLQCQLSQPAYLSAVKGHSGHHLAENLKPISSVNL